jgi:hypothetical protein
MSERKLCLFACACYRHIATLRNDSGILDALIVAEQRVDSGSGLTKLITVLQTAGLPPMDLTNYWEDRPFPGMAALPRMEVVHAQQVAWHAARALQSAGGQSDWSSVRKAQVSLLCDLIGHLSRSSAIDRSWVAWNDGTVQKMARAIYEDGHFHDLPILADALEDAGCDDQHLLDHCRGQAVHVRGCWVIDAILGKE